mmetsp:Transcript_17668/g.49716  ORF Transcript_17668/g.49716 Transcript_17668/m.49716 type:complete len:235 (+) Transcript_17668:1342-2046(+)
MLLLTETLVVVPLQFEQALKVRLAVEASVQAGVVPGVQGLVTFCALETPLVEDYALDGHLFDVVHPFPAVRTFFCRTKLSSSRSFRRSGGRVRGSLVLFGFEFFLTLAGGLFFSLGLLLSLRLQPLPALLRVLVLFRTALLFLTFPLLKRRAPLHLLLLLTLFPLLLAFLAKSRLLLALFCRLLLSLLLRLLVLALARFAQLFRLALALLLLASEFFLLRKLLLPRLLLRITVV